MGIFSALNPMAFSSRDNSSDIILTTENLNLITLTAWNYTYYSNRTLSNGSTCVLFFKPFMPVLLKNGTFLNSTSCYSPVEPMRARSKIGLAFACLFAASLVFTVINLRRSRKLIAPENDIHGTGRKCQWYWMLATCVLALISSITDVDVDRYYLPELPLVLTSIFWFLMVLTTLAAVWECVRHWGNSQQRRIVDPSPSLTPRCARISKVDGYLPWLFYFCLWMVTPLSLFNSHPTDRTQNFFMIFPRSWMSIEKQRSDNQTATFAEPTATDLRFKLASVFLFACWLTTLYSLHHSIQRYVCRGDENSIFTFVKHLPIKFRLIIPLSLALVGYETACSLYFSVSPLYINTSLGMVYGFGWAVPLLIVIMQSISGLSGPNDDIEIQRQQQIRLPQSGAAVSV
jgi:hypothetical protein